MPNDLALIVYGASDDLLELDGGIRDEFNAYADSDRPLHLALNDGTVLEIVYNGRWRINRVQEGAAEYSKEEAIDDDGRREDRPGIPAYSDVVTLTISPELAQGYMHVEGLKWRWAMLGQYAKA